MNKLNNPSSILDLISSTNELIDKTLQKQDNITSSTNIDTLVEGIYYISSTPSNLPNGLKYLIQLGSTIQIAFDQTTGIVYHRAKVGGSFSDWYSCADYEDIPSVGNGTITITQGGVTKGTFTTNQSGNLTIDLDAGSVSGTLTNIATGSNSMVVSSATATDATGVTALGKDASIASGNNGTNGVAIGYNAKCGDSNNSGSAGVAVGKGAGVYSTNGTAVGSASMTGGAYATAIGSGADAEGNYSIQIGKGTNTESNSMYVSVGLSDSKNYKMLDTNGKIPDDRLNTTIARTSQIPTVPTKTSDLTNDSGYITGITSSDVTTALGYTPYDSSNPSGYTTNTGTVTSVNNVSPVNGNVTLSIPAAQVNSDWNATSGKAQILNKPSLATVATSGSYNDLSNKPTIPAAVTVDSALSTTSENPVQNKVITTEINKKLENTATGNNGLTVGGTASTTGGSTNVGMSSIASKSYSTAVGYNSQAKGNYSTTVGWNAMATKQNAIQIGWGTNTTENSLSVGFYNQNNYQMLDGTTGKIPNDRIKYDGTTITVNNNGELTSTGGGGTSTDVQINGTSITSSGVADIKTNGTYNASTNKIATMSDLSSKANDNSVVHLTGDETIAGNKKFVSGSTSYAINAQSSAIGSISASGTYGFQVSAYSNINLALGGKDLTYYSTDNNTNYTLLTGSTGKIPDARINKQTSITSSSTDDQIPSAKCVYDELTDKADIDLSNVPTSKGILTESYVNGTSGYRVYADNYCIQWGRFTGKTGTINLLKSYANTNYSVAYSSDARISWYCGASAVNAMSVGSDSSNSHTCFWITTGFLGEQ